MPRLSDTMTTGTVANWLKKVGDTAQKILEKTPEMLEKAGKTIKEISDFGKRLFKKGAADDDIDGGADDLMPDIAKVSYLLEKTKDIIRYNFRTAKIRHNLSKFSVKLNHMEKIMLKF